MQIIYLSVNKMMLCMKRGYFIIIALVTCVFCGHAQSVFDFVLNGEGRVTAVPRFKVLDFRIPEYSYKTYTPSTTFELEKKLREFTPDFPLSADQRPMDMQVLSLAYRPFFNVFTPMIRRVSPMALDFQELEYTPISETTGLLTVGEQFTWPGVGGLTRVSSSLVWSQERWTLTGGAFAGRYFTPFNYSPDFMAGFNASVAFDATDWMTIRGWGQYAFYQKGERTNPHMLLNPYYNHTSVGGALEFKVKNDFKLGFGINYEYNPWNKRMDPQFLFYPAFKNKNIRIGIN